MFLDPILPSERLSKPTEFVPLEVAENLMSAKIAEWMPNAIEFSRARKEAEKEAKRERKAAPTKEDIANSQPYSFDAPVLEEEQISMDVPRLALAFPASTGKTVATQNGQKPHVAEGAKFGNFTTSMALGKEIHEKAKAAGINSRMLLGRDQIDEDGTPMCQKAELAKLAAAHGLNVKKTMCLSHSVSEKGERIERKCPFFDTCRYNAQQKKREEGEILIASHQYLRVQSTAFKDCDVVVADESFWANMLGECVVDLKEFLALRTVGKKCYAPRKGMKMEAVTRDADERSAELNFGIECIRKAILAARNEGRDLTIADLRAAGVTEAMCKFSAGAEYTRIESSGIYPDTPVDQAFSILENLERQNANRFARIWNCLEKELSCGREDECAVQSLAFEGAQVSKRGGTTVVEDRVRVLYSTKPKFGNIPVLVLDANAEEGVLKSFWPNIEYMKVDVAPAEGVVVKQLCDKTGSRASLMSDLRGDQMLRLVKKCEAKYAQEVSLDESKRPLVVTHKALEDKWYDNGDWACEAYTAALGHFGGMRGIDAYKNTVCYIGGGRPEPSVEAIEKQARQLYAFDPIPLNFIKSDETGHKVFPRETVTMTDKNGRSVEISISYHPDPRCDLLLRQAREAEISQCFARIRPLRSKGCEVIMLTNIPFGIQPDHYVTWNELVPDLFDECADARGVVFENSRDMAAAYPDLWPSDAAVRQALKRRTAHAETSEFERIMTAAQNNELLSGWVRVEFARKGSNKTNARVCKRHAWVRTTQFGTSEEQIVAAILAFLPDAQDFVIGALPIDETGAVYELRIGVVFPSWTIRGRHNKPVSEMSFEERLDHTMAEIANMQYLERCADNDWGERDFESMMRNSRPLVPTIEDMLEAA